MASTRTSGTKSKLASGKVYFIGSGPGDPELITVKGKNIIADADLIIYAGSLVNPQVLSGAQKNARILDSASMTLEEITREMICAARQGQVVARLHSGDPSIYGAIAEQIHILKRAKVPCAVVPGVTSAVAAAAALQKEFTLPGCSQTLIITRRAGNTPVPERESLQHLAAHQASMAIFLSTSMIAETVNELKQGGYPSVTPVAVVYRASWPDERVIFGTLDSIVSQIKTARLRRQAIILVGNFLKDSTGGRSRLYDGEYAHGFRPARGSWRTGMAVIALTAAGCVLGKKIISAIKEADLFVPAALATGKNGRIYGYTHFEQQMGLLFQTYQSIICIMATGIAVRMVAPYLKTKWEDPAIVVMDEQGNHIISLLSGHWGGANRLARKLAKLCGGHSVITTASDVNKMPALDLIVGELAADGFERWKLTPIQAALIAGKPVGLYPQELSTIPELQGVPHLFFYDSPDKLCSSHCKAGVAFTHRKDLPVANRDAFLFAHPKDIVIGIGCNRGIAVRELEAAISAVCKQLDLPVSSVCSLCTIDKKKQEPGLLTYAEARSIPLTFFTTTELNNVTIPSRPSFHARRVFGVQGVAEPAAMLGAPGGDLLLKKVKFKNITIAVARMPFTQLLKNYRERAQE
jgi:precorrin-4 C11-methyltransferase